MVGSHRVDLKALSLFLLTVESFLIVSVVYRWLGGGSDGRLTWGDDWGLLWGPLATFFAGLDAMNHGEDVFRESLKNFR